MQQLAFPKMGMQLVKLSANFGVQESMFLMAELDYFKTFSPNLLSGPSKLLRIIKIGLDSNIIRMNKHYVTSFPVHNYVNRELRYCPGY